MKKLEPSKSAIVGVLWGAFLKYCEFVPDELAWDVFAIFEPQNFEPYVKEVWLYVFGGGAGGMWWRSRNPKGAGFDEQAATDTPQQNVSKGVNTPQAAVYEPTTVQTAPTLAPKAVSPIGIEKIRADLMRDEGYRDEIYSDSEGLPTIGIGHLITPEDPEHGMPIGTKVSAARIDELFKEDFTQALNDARSVVSDFDSHPAVVRRNLVNMAFNLGLPRLRKFKKTLALIEQRKYAEAGEESMRSKWSKQVGNRADRILANFKLAETTDIALA